MEVSTNVNHMGLHFQIKQGIERSNVILSEDAQLSLFNLLAKELGMEVVVPIKGDGGFTKDFKTSTVEQLEKRIENLEELVADNAQEAFGHTIEQAVAHVKDYDSIIDLLREQAERLGLLEDKLKPATLEIPSSIETNEGRGYN